MRALHLSAIRPTLAMMIVAVCGIAAVGQTVGPPAPPRATTSAGLPDEVARAQDRFDVYLVQDRGEHRAVVQLREGEVVSAEFDGRRLSPADVRLEGRSLVVYDGGAPVAAFRVPGGLLESPAAAASEGRPPWMPPPDAGRAGVAGLGLDVAPAGAEALRATTYRDGVLVRQIRDQTAADYAGLRSGDIIVAVDGQIVCTVDDLERRVGERTEGAARVTFLRDRREQWTTLRLGELPNRRYGTDQPGDLGPESDWRPDPERVLGLSFEEVGAQPLEDVLEYDRGLRILSITRDGPADEAGLREGDILVAVGRTPVTSGDDVRDALRESPAGERVRLRIVREGSVFNVPVEPRRASEPAASAREPAELERELGIEAAWADEESLGGPGPWESGVLIERVAGGSVAEGMGLQRGDVIVALNDEAMPTPEQLSRRLGELDRSRPVRVTYVRGGEQRIARFRMRP